MVSLRLVLAAAFVVFWAGTASADPSADLRTKINTAMASVASMQIAFTAGNGASGVAFVLPHGAKMRVELTLGPASLELYEVNGFLYRSLNGGPWTKAKLRPGQDVFDFTRSLDPRASVSAGPDQTENGLSYGTVTIDQPLAVAGENARTGPLGCSYDKTTFRLHRCANDGVTMTYSDYDDPKIAVDLPADAAAAPAAQAQP